MLFPVEVGAHEDGEVEEVEEGPLVTDQEVKHPRDNDEEEDNNEFFVYS